MTGDDTVGNRSARLPSTSSILIRRRLQRGGEKRHEVAAVACQTTPLMKQQPESDHFQLDYGMDFLFFFFF